MGSAVYGRCPTAPWPPPTCHPPHLHSSILSRLRFGSPPAGFVAFILDPIYQLFDAIMTDKAEKVERMLKTLGVVLKGEEKDLKAKALLKRVMQKWLPAGDTLLEMIVLHLPSPRDAQKYRTPLLYEVRRWTKLAPSPRFGRGRVGRGVSLLHSQSLC